MTGIKIFEYKFLNAEILFGDYGNHFKNKTGFFRSCKVPDQTLSSFHVGAERHSCISE